MDLTPTKSVQQKRVNEQLLSYWASLKQGREFPDESDIDTGALKDIWDACFLVHVEGEGADIIYRFAYLGDSIIEAYGDVRQGQEVCKTLVFPLNDDMTGKCEEVRSTGRAVMDDNEFTNNNKMLVKSRNCLLPLGHAGKEGVHYIIGSMNWKAF